MQTDVERSEDCSATQSYAYARVFDVHIPVSAQTVLSYWMLPQQANGAYVAVDFLFTDGSSLRDSGAVDQFGVRVHPQMQGQGGHLAQLDLGGTRGIKRFVVRHAGAGGEPVSYNTRDFTVAVSPDAATWTTVASVSGNADSVTAHPVAAVSMRYVRLSVTAGTQTGEPVSRIYEIEVYGT